MFLDAGIQVHRIRQRQTSAKDMNHRALSEVLRMIAVMKMLKSETSLPKYDEEEENILYFNDLFHFNVIYPDDSKSDKDNDDDEIDIKQFSGNNEINVDDGAYDVVV
ncbi:hypothetical protein Tco_0569614 [Tanacetum coccineum]